MMIERLLVDWPALAAIGAIASLVPHAGWAFGAGILSGVHWLARGGESLVVDRVLRERAGRTAA